MLIVKLVVCVSVVSYQCSFYVMAIRQTCLLLPKVLSQETQLNISFIVIFYMDIEKAQSSFGPIGSLLINIYQ